MKRWICLLLAACCAFLLTGCTEENIREDNTPVATLPPAEARYSAPDGDGIVATGREYRIYLPGKDGLRLISRSVRLEGADRLADRGLDAPEELGEELVSARNGGESRDACGIVEDAFELQTF